MQSLNSFLKLLIGALLGLSSCVLLAQPIVGGRYEGHLFTEMDYQVPLPPGAWKVTTVQDWEEQRNKQRYVVLQNLNPNAITPFLVVRYAYQIYGAQWSHVCSSNNTNQFGVNAFGTQASQRNLKCLRLFTSTLPVTSANKYWTSIASGFDDFPQSLRSEGFILAEFSTSMLRQNWVRVEMFLRTKPSNLTANRVRQAINQKEYLPWADTFTTWAGNYMTALDAAVHEKPKSPAVIAAFSPPVMATPSVVAATPAAVTPAPTAQDRSKPVPPTSEITAQANKQLAEEKLRQDNLRLESEKSRLEQAARDAQQRASEQEVEKQKLQAELDRLRSEKEKTSAITPSNGGRKALVIGNKGYKYISPLVTSMDDARSVADQWKRYGYAVTLVLDANEREMKGAIRQFASQVQGGDEVAIFYAGHGVQIGNTNYLIPVDVNGESEAQIRDEAVPLHRLLDDLNERKARFTLAVIDACRDNPFKSASRNIGAGTRGLASTTAATGQMLIFSAGAGQKALDNLGPNDKSKNGVFTRVFLDQMRKTKGPVDKVLKDTRVQVVRLAQSVGHEQVPAIYDQVVGEFFFTSK
jgi:hypothetical protein